MAASTEVDLIVKAVAQGFESVSGDINKVGTAVSDSGKKAAEGGTRFTELASKLSIANTAYDLVGSKVVEFGKQALNAASDVQEMQSKFNIVFSEVGGKVTAELDKFGAAAGRSKFELREMAATLGDTLKPMGFSEEKAGDFSVQLTQLATDLSSFNNMEMDEALRRLQGTLIGSHENALAFGVIINENTLKAELARNGWDKLTGAQLEQAKVQARINLLMAGTSDAQGDAIRTADGYANQQRALAAATEELSVVIGTMLLPVATGITGILIDAAQAATGLSSQMAQIGAATKDTNTPFSDAAIILNEINKAMGGIPADDFVQDLKEWERGTALSNAELKALDEQFANLDGTLSKYITTSDDAVASQRNLFNGLEETSEQLAYAALVAKDNASAGEEMVVTSDDLAAAEERRAEATKAATERTEAATKAAAELAAEQARLSAESGDLFTQYADATDGFEFFTQSLASMGEHYITVGGLTDEQSASLEELRGEYEKTQDEIRSLTSGTAGLGLTQEELNEKMAEQQEQAALLTEAIAPLAAVQGELQAVNNQLAIDYEAVDSAMIAAADAAGASAEQLAILQIATGDLSEEQAEALLKQVAIEQSIKALGEAYAGGTISLQEYRDQAIASVDEINALDFSFDTEAGTVITPQVDTAVATEQLTVFKDEQIAMAEEGYAAVTEGADTTTASTIALDESMVSAILTTTELDSSFGSMILTMTDVQKEAYAINEAVGAIPKEVVITVTVNQVGEVPSIPGGRAAGGPVSAGVPYVVGERGPEMFMPATSGTIVPNNQIGNIGGSKTITINQEYNAPVTPQMARAARDNTLAALSGVGLA